MGKFSYLHIVSGCCFNSFFSQPFLPFHFFFGFCFWFFVRARAQIRALGRNTRGSIAMRLKEGDKMASIDIIPASLQKGLEKVSDANQGR